MSSVSYSSKTILYSGISNTHQIEIRSVKGFFEVHIAEIGSLELVYIAFPLYPQQRLYAAQGEDIKVNNPKNFQKRNFHYFVQLHARLQQ